MNPHFEKQESSNPVLSVKIKSVLASFNLDVVFDTGPGVTALFGPSGAGKSMILNAISGLSKPQEGRITLFGEPVFDSQSGLHQKPERRRIGYVFQQGRLFPHLSVEANLLYGTQFVPDDTKQMNYAEVVNVLGVRSLLERRIHDLSGGEQQRVAIGRALMTSPRLILMDEPLASLDPARRQEILPFIEHLRDAFHVPIIYVSHSLDEVIRLADTAIVLDSGQVRAQGEAEDILNRADLRPLFGLADATNVTAAPQVIITCKVSEHDRAFDLTRLHGRGLSFWVPKLERPIGSHLRIQVRATDIALSSKEPDETSILNRFHGTIETLDAAHPGYADVEIKMASGLSLWARVTQKSAMKLGLETGHDVWAMVKSVAIARGTLDPVPLKAEV
jgi:molybdate transport system ATP-binding protein